jgi:hypothetical protein
MSTSTSFWNRLLRLSEGRPGFRLYAVVAHEGHALVLLMKGVYLHLVNRRRHVVEHLDVHQAVRLEVADADGAQLAGLVGRFHRTPGAVHVAIGLVDQEQVQMVELQAAQRLVDGLADALEAGVLHPELARDEEVIARHATTTQSFPDSLFVHVGSRGVDQAVARLDGADDAALALRGIGDLEDAEAGDRHPDAVVQGDVVHGEDLPTGCSMQSL